MSEVPSELAVCDRHRKEMLAHLQGCLPEEGCGLVGGRFEPAGAQVEAVLPVTNEIHSPVKFYMAPLEQLKALTWLEQNDLDLVAIFHSHPVGPAGPSPTDLAEFAYPGVLYLIFSPGEEEAWQARAFWITEDSRAVSEVPLRWVPEC